MTAPIMPLAATALPAPLGKPPLNVAQLLRLDVLVSYPKPTHFTGPVVSGPVPGTLEGVQGSTLLQAPFSIDYTMGDFEVPAQFPRNSFLYLSFAYTHTAFTSPPTFLVSSESGKAGDILTATLPAPDVLANQPVSATFPAWNAVLPKIPFRCWVGVTGNAANTAGGGIVQLIYGIVPTAWF